MAKLSTGYYQTMDPTNGYIAINRCALSLIPLDKLAQDYFFETDLLFRLYLSRAVVLDLPMNAHYDDEVSNLKITKVIIPFFYRHLRNLMKRVFYNYFLRDFNVASLEFVLSCTLMTFGFSFGVFHWVESAKSMTATPIGTIMISTLTIILGFQLFLSALFYDMSNIPQIPLSKSL